MQSNNTVLSDANPSMDAQHGMSMKMHNGQHTAHPDDPAKHGEHMALLDLVPHKAATHTAARDGSWFDASTWSNGKIPGKNARVVIPENITVDYDGMSDASLFTVRVDGQLDFATDADTRMVVDTFVVSPDGTLTIGTENNPVSGKVETSIVIADNGRIDTKWDPKQLSRGLISHGTVEIHGQEKTSHLKVAADPAAGDRTIVLESTPQNWQVGDTLVLTGTRFTPGGQSSEDEVVEITAIKGNRITLDRPLEFDHDAPRGDLKAYVANYSRNVVIETENADKLPAHQRGHVMFMHSDNVDVRYAEFHELGRTDKSKPLDDFKFKSGGNGDRILDGNGDPIEGDRTNVRGRYAVHLHRTGVNGGDEPAVLVGNSVMGSPGWGFVHHDSYAILEDNAAYDVLGAAFVTETGNEIGAWRNNIAIKSEGSDISQRGEKSGTGNHDLGFDGHGFWFQGRLVHSEGNVAASSDGSGFFYFHRGSDQLKPLSDNLPVEGWARGKDTTRVDVPSIQGFSNNEVLASASGLTVIKNSPDQGHDGRSVLENFTAWEVQRGVEVQYTARYTLKDFTLIGTENSNKYWENQGVRVAQNAEDFVFNGLEIDGFTTGIDLFKQQGSQKLPSKDWGYVFIDADLKNNKEDFKNVNPKTDRFLTQKDLKQGRLEFDLSPKSDLESKKGDRFFEHATILGNKTDSIGTIPIEFGDDVFAYSDEGIRNIIQDEGYYTLPDGQKAIVVEEYISDRATGALKKYPLVITFDTDSWANGAPNRGKLNPSRLKSKGVSVSLEDISIDYPSVADIKPQNASKLKSGPPKSGPKPAPQPTDIPNEGVAQPKPKPDPEIELDPIAEKNSDSKENLVNKPNSSPKAGPTVVAELSDSNSDSGSDAADQPLMTFALIDAKTNKVVENYENLQTNSTLDLDTLKIEQYSLVAQLNPSHPDAGKVQSVRFESPNGNRVENLEPYALFGDNKNDGYLGKLLKSGSYTLKATAYSKDQAEGNTLASTNLSYTVVGETKSPALTGQVSASESLLKFALVDAKSNKIVKGYEDLATVDTIDLNKLDFTQFNIAAQVNSKHPDAGKVQSVRFKSPYGDRVDSLEPYALLRENNGDYWGKQLKVGDYDLKATAYTSDRGNGQILSTTDLSYTVTDEATKPIPTPQPQSSESLLKFALVDAKSNKIVKGYEDLATLDTIDLNKLDFTQFNIAAQVNSKHPDAGKVQSVRFKSPYGDRVDSLEPYALLRENNGDYWGKRLKVGDYDLKATAYTSDRGKGQILSTTDLSYTVTDEATTPTPTPKPDPKPKPIDPQPDPVNPSPDPIQSLEFEQAVVRLTNEFRQKNGLKPLAMDTNLGEAADVHSQNMAKQDFFSHTGKDGSKPWQRAQKEGYESSFVGENIAAGTLYRTPEAVVQGWIDSPGHRANMLSNKFNEIGVGYHLLENDTGKVNYNHYWTQVFGRGNVEKSASFTQEMVSNQTDRTSLRADALPGTGTGAVLSAGPEAASDGDLLIGSEAQLVGDPDTQDVLTNYAKVFGDAVPEADLLTGAGGDFIPLETMALTTVDAVDTTPIGSSSLMEDTSDADPFSETSPMGTGSSFLETDVVKTPALVG